MRYDEFPHVIVFQEEQSASDGGGGRTKDWVDVITTEAFVCPVTSRERYLAEQAQNPVDYNVFFHFREDLKRTMRIKHGNKILKLKSKPIDQGGQGEIMLLKCEES